MFGTNDDIYRVTELLQSDRRAATFVQQTDGTWHVEAAGRHYLFTDEQCRLVRASAAPEVVQAHEIFDPRWRH